MFLFDFSWPIQHFLNQFWWQINFLLLIILIILGFLSWKKPAYAVGLTIIFLPIYLFRSKIWFLPFTFLELCIWITFIGWLVNQIKNKELGIRNIIKPYPLLPTPYSLKTYHLPILLILAAATVSVFIGPNLAAAAGIWKAYFIEPIMFFLVLINVLKTEEDKKIVLWSLGISTLSISLLAIFQKFTGFGIPEPDWLNPAARRVTAMFTSPNAVGLYLAPIVLIYLGWILAELKNYKGNILKLFIVLPALLAILFTVSQGTWLGLAAGLAFILFFGWNKKITTGLILAIIILALILPLSREKILPLIAFSDPAGQNRLALIQISRDYLFQSPKNFIFGAGIGGFAQIQNQSRDPLKLEPLLYPHNIILNFWLETGLLGLIGFCWLIILFFKNGFGGAIHELPLRWAVLAAMVCLIAHGLIDVPYFKNDLAVLFWVIIGLL